ELDTAEVEDGAGDPQVSLVDTSPGHPLSIAARPLATFDCPVGRRDNRRVSSPPRLECRGLAKSFVTPTGHLDALGPADLTVGVGEFVALVGPSGCGKSTLFNLVAGLESATAG